MKVAMLIGNQPNQIALANKVAGHFELTGIVLQQKPAKKKAGFPLLISKAVEKLFFGKINKAWFNMLSHYAISFPSLPADVPVFNTQKINTHEVSKFLLNCGADVLMVSGTTMVKKPLLDLYFPKGILNLHTGFSPYVKGGPNCTNWCIANFEFEKIGNTIMWIDEGIDSGNILSSALAPLSGNETLNELHILVMEHAQKLYIDCLSFIETNYSSAPSIKQSEITDGKTFYSRDWNFKARKNLIRNWRAYKKTVQSPAFQIKQQSLQKVSLPQ